MKPDSKAVPADITIDGLEKKLREMICLDGPSRNVYSVSELVNNIPIENKHFKIDFPRIRDDFDMLLSDDLLGDEMDIGIEPPSKILTQSEHRTIVMIGVSGCGKTRTCFDICRGNFSLYFDCTHPDFKKMIELLEEERKKKSVTMQEEFESFSTKILQCVIIARLLVLRALFERNIDYRPIDWLQVQRSEKSQLLFVDLLHVLCSSKISITNLSFKLISFFNKLSRTDGWFIFDESQILLSHLSKDYRSSKAGLGGITAGKIDHPRSLLSFLTNFIIGSGYRSIWCGTHLRIGSLELFQSAAGEKSSEMLLFTGFNYLKPEYIRKLLQKWLKNSPTPAKLEEISHTLQGRPRFLASFVRILARSPQSNIDFVFNTYVENTTTTSKLLSGENLTLFDFWKIHLRSAYSSFNDPDSRTKSIFDLLVKLCISFLFGDGKDMKFSSDLDMVSTGLVMVSHSMDGWYGRMAEPLALMAGLNVLSIEQPHALMDYFMDKLFAPLGAPNISPAERGNLMELIVVLKFIQCWWEKAEFKKYLTFVPSSVQKPRGVVDGRRGNNSALLFIEQLRNPEFPWILLPATKAGPDLRYSFISAHVKTAWERSSVGNRESLANEKTMDAESWYSSDKRVEEKCRDALKAMETPLTFLRIELPYTSSKQESLFKSEQGKICIDLNSELAIPFFGERFVKRYKEFIENK